MNIGVQGWMNEGEQGRISMRRRAMVLVEMWAMTMQLFRENIALGLRALSEGVVEILWPTRCVICDTPGSLLCRQCRLSLPYIDRLYACPNCGQANGKHACVDCNSFMIHHRCSDSSGSSFEMLDGADQIVSAVSFRGDCCKLVTTFKDRKELRLAAVLAEVMAAYINPSWLEGNDANKKSNDTKDEVRWEEACLERGLIGSGGVARTRGQYLLGGLGIVAIPAREQAIRERGFDHMKEVGRHLSRISGLPLLDLLSVNSEERKDQRGLSAMSRKQNMRESFVAKDSLARSDLRSAVLPERVVLIDDVYTTGATITAAANVIKKMGVKHVYGLTFARLP